MAHLYETTYKPPDIQGSCQCRWQPGQQIRRLCPEANANKNDNKTILNKGKQKWEYKQRQLENVGGSKPPTKEMGADTQKPTMDMTGVRV